MICAAPKPERIAYVTVRGAEFCVAWEDEELEEATYQFGRFPASRVCWVDAVRMDGVWFCAIEALSVDLCNELNAALRQLQDHREAA